MRFSSLTVVFLYLAGFLECCKIKLKAVLMWVTVSDWKRI